jgi:trimeric autotransporter adhesin
MLRARFVSLCAIATVLFASTLLNAQQSAVAPRIVAPVDESKLIALPGGVPLLARSEFDLGRAPASTQMTSVRLVLSRSLQQETALRKFMAEQLDPASQNYRKWLTPDQFGKLYGTSDTDIQVLVTWLESRGFTVQPAPQGRVSISFSGSVSQIEAAFHTEIHSFHGKEQEFLSNISAPKIPSALAPVVSGIAGLNTIRPRTHNVSASSGTYDPKQKRFVPVDNYASGARPFLTIGSAASGYNFYVVPADAATIYNTPNTFNAGFNNGSSYGGFGVTIGIGGDAPIQADTVASYRSLFLANAPQITITTVGTAPTSTTDTDEAYIDTELSGGLAPGAAIDFYTAVNLSDAINQAIEDNKVDIFSLSFGSCEANLTTADNQLINSWWQQAAAQGIAVTVSTGDSGAAGCDNDNTEQVAQFGLQVSGFASTPYNIAVGGTDFSALLSNFGSYVSTSNGANYGSAISYIPESTWNNSAVTDGLLAQNTPYKNSSAETDIAGGSGGASSCSTNANNSTNTTIATCTSGYAKPSWQTGSGVPPDGVRDLPDVSLFASNGFDGASWLVCTDDTFTQNGVTYTTNCAVQSGGGFSFAGYGGTSTSAPAFAGILALVQQKTGNRLGQAAKNLYGLYNGPNASAIFHDTTTGNISVPCTSGTPNCSKNTAGYYFLTGYNTAAGYDLATGLGSVNVTNLINYWSSASGGSAATVSATVTPSPATTDQIVTVTGYVTGSAGTPTGTVTLSAPAYSAPSTSSSATYISSPATIDSSGQYSITVPVGTLQVGNDTLTLSYYGDSTYAVATGTATVTITGLTPSLTVTPASSTLISTQPLSVAVSLTGSGPTPTGGVSLDAGNYFGTGSLSAGKASFTIPGGTFTSSGPQPITLSYSGDAYYAAGFASGSVTVTIPPTPTVTVTPGSSSIEVTQPLTVAIKVTGSGATPTGTVLISSSPYYSGTASLSGGKATVTIPGESLYSPLITATDGINVQYSGDINYSAASGSATVVVSPTVPTITVVPASATIYTGQALAVTVQATGPAGSVAPSGGFTVNTGGPSFQGSLASGSGIAIIPANTLPVGTDALSVTYSGDNFDTSAAGSASVTVTASSFTLAGPTTQPSISSPGGTASSTVTISTSTNYTGGVTVSCTPTTSPTGADNSPTCLVADPSVNLGGATTSGTATVNFSTIATSAVPGSTANSGSVKPRWTKAGAATLVALLVFFGIPARRRAWRAIVGVLVLIAAFGTLSACGGANGGGGGGGGGGSTGTTAGTYTFTVTATGMPAISSAPSTVITLTVN